MFDVQALDYNKNSLVINAVSTLTKVEMVEPARL
jgi:hypothetical protein